MAYIAFKGSKWRKFAPNQGFSGFSCLFVKMVDLSPGQTMEKDDKAHSGVLPQVILGPLY